MQDAVDQGIESEGSDLSGVSAKLCWSEEFPPVVESAKEPGSNAPVDTPSISQYESEEIKRTLKKGLLGSQPSSEAEDSGLETRELAQTRALEAVHLQLNLEAGLLFPLVLR